MLLPNKTVSYEESSIYKSILILRKLNKKQNFTIKQLYKSLQSNFEDVYEFIDAIDLLYLTDKIIVEGEFIKYVK